LRKVTNRKGIDDISEHDGDNETADKNAAENLIVGGIEFRTPYLIFGKMVLPNKAWQIKKIKHPLRAN
jgi:hypothetical protein